MAEEFKPGQIVPASKGGGFLRADIARGFRSSWSMRAKHVSEVRHLHQEASPQDALIGAA
jgi:hypothetical protein